MADNVTLPGTGTNTASDDVGSVHYQRIKRSVGADGSATDFLDKSTRQDTYTTTGSGTAVDVSAQAMRWFGLQVKGTGAAATSWTVNLQVSLDGTNYATALTHTNTADSDGGIVWISTPAPALYFRSNVSAVVLGSATNIVATIIGAP